MFFNIFNFTFLSRSSKWPKLRKEFLKAYPTCAACGSNKDLEVHHIVPVSIDPSKELQYSNLITLCSKPCHFLFGHLNNYKSYNKDVIKDCSYFLYKINNRP